MAKRSVNETIEARNTRKKRRFVRWQRTLPKHTRYLTELVAERLLPQFESRGFIWHDKATAGYLYLVKPGQDWLGLSFDRTGFFDPDELPHTLRPDQSTGQ